jgi:Flp pilus assembly protein TadG
MTYHPAPSRANRRPAAAATEFAFVALVFFIFILGMVEVGRGMMVVHLLTNAARMGCRTGVVEGRTNTDISNAVLNNLSAQGISTETVTVQVNDNTAAVSTASPGDEVTVLVSVPTSTVSWIPGARFLTGPTLNGKYTLRRE